MDPRDVIFNSEQGFVIYYNKLVAGLPAPSTVIPSARTATYDDISFEGHWLIKDAEGHLLAIIPDREVMVILKLETVGPASDANQPK